MSTETTAFEGTKQQETNLHKELDKLKRSGGTVMSGLQKAQEIYGYLPKEVQLVVAEKFDVSLEEVYGVATFYSQFALNPKGEHVIGVCMGTACYVKGAGELCLEIENQLGIKGGECTADRKFSFDVTRCIGCCGLAPVLTVGSDVYGKIAPKDIAGIIAKYK